MWLSYMFVKAMSLQGSMKLHPIKVVTLMQCQHDTGASCRQKDIQCTTLSITWPKNGRSIFPSIDFTFEEMFMVNLVLFTEY